MSSVNAETSQALAKKYLGYLGKMISASKSMYTKRHPKNVVFFNGNVYDSDAQKIWYGDIDITKESKKLKALAKELGAPIYCTSESPYRFYESLTKKALTREILEADSRESVFPRVIKFA